MRWPGRCNAWGSASEIRPLPILKHVTLLSDEEPAEWRTGEAGDWQTARPLCIILPDHTFNGLTGVGYSFLGSDLLIGGGFEWNGSDFVADTHACGIPSLFHDVACEALEGARLSWWKRWKLRRLADKWYAIACDLRGMLGGRSGVRFWGLRFFGSAWGMLKRIRKERDGD